ncbi:Gfo/Idh/MocA family protein [Ochrobactrum teleogrylli]
MNTRTGKIRVGIVGLQPEISWAARAHLPALHALQDKFEIVGVANTSRASAEVAAKACNIPLAFDNVQAMAASPEIDLISVTVRVPYHYELSEAAISQGKHVYCEWPLGNGLAEARAMADMACKAGVLAVAGTQARVSPEIRHLRRLLSEGYVGRVLSSTVTARGRSWGATHADAKNRGYLLHNKNGATMLTIPLGHTLAALRDTLGEFKAISAIVENRRGSILLPETKEVVSFDAPDQVAILGRIGDNVPITVHYRGGMPRELPGFVWEINGSDGDLRVTGSHGGSQQVQLTVEGARGDDRKWTAIDLPEDLMDDFTSLDINPANVARIYSRVAHDLQFGSCSAPTFDDAVELHRVIDAIETASRTGARVDIRSYNRLLEQA